MKVKSNKSRKIKLEIALLAVFLTGVASEVRAGAWPVRPGKLLLSPSFSYFYANRIWDRKGKVSDYPDSGYFKSSGLYLYSEYGASRRITIVTSIPFVSNTFNNSKYKTTATGFSDAELGTRIYLFNLNFKFYCAIQGTAIIPLYVNTQEKSMGLQVFGSDVKLIGSGIGQLGGDRSLYYNIEIGARDYFDTDGPLQYKSTVSAGLNIDKENQILLGATGVKSISTNKAFSNNLTQNKDYSYLQASLSIGHSFSNNFSVFAGYNQSVIGRNTGISTNLSLSFVSKF